MNDKYLNHPNEPKNIYLFLVLYYQYYDYIKLRSHICREHSKYYEYGEIQDPILIGELECDLQVLEKEEIELLNNTELELDDKTPRMKEIENERIKIFKKLDKHGLNAWCGYKIEPVSENDGDRKYKIQFRYI